MNALPEYVSPVPAVVVAPEDTTPPNTANPPLDNDGNDRVPIEALVDDEVVNDPYVVDEKLNLFTPVQKLVSASRVVDAVLSVDVIVIGAEPNATNDVHDVEPVHDTVVVAVVLTSPPVPRYATPCPSDDSRSGPENVDDAVENIPLVNPIVVDVLLYPACVVNGNTVNPASLLNHDSCTDDEAIVFTLPFVPVYVNPCASDGKKKLPDCVDDAVEKNPLSRPSAVDVLL